MLSIRSFNRFFLTCLFLSALSVSTGVSAKTFLMEFKVGPSTGTAPSPFWPTSISPGDTLLDFTFDAVVGDGLQRDQPNELVLRIGATPTTNKRDLNLYNWGQTGQHGNVAATITSQLGTKVFRDFQPRNGFIDDGTTGGFFNFLAPHPNNPSPGGPGLASYTLGLQSFSRLPGEDRIYIFGSPGARYFSGDWAISEVSAVPVPAAVWLFGTALIGFVGMSRRRKIA